MDKAIINGRHHLRPASGMRNNQSYRHFSQASDWNYDSNECLICRSRNGNVPAVCKWNRKTWRFRK